jgi:hypothetical protein
MATENLILANDLKIKGIVLEIMPRIKSSTGSESQKVRIQVGEFKPEHFELTFLKTNCDEVFALRTGQEYTFMVVIKGNKWENKTTNKITYSTQIIAWKIV